MERAGYSVSFNLAPVSRQVKYIFTASLCFSYFAFGNGYNIFGPTLLDLRELYKCTLDDVSYGFVIRSATYCIGALACGWAFNLINRQLGFTLCLFGCGISVLITPYMTTVFGFLIAQGIFGFCSAGIDVAANSWLLEMWSAEANPFIQSLHFSYAVGSTLAPLISEPYLSPDTNTLEAASKIADVIKPFESEIHIPYTILAMIIFGAAAIQLILFFAFPYKEMKRDFESTPGTKMNNNLESVEFSDDAPLVPIKLPLTYTILIVFLGGFLLCFESGVELNAFNYLQAFAVKLHLSKSTGAFMSAVLSGAFTIFRGLSIYVATRVRTSSMLYFDLTLVLVGNLIILFFAQETPMGLWIGIIFLGSGLSSCFPGICAFLEERINVNTLVCGVFMFMSSIATTVTPLIAGRYMETFPMIYGYINMTCGLVCVGLFVALHFTDSLRKRYSLVKLSSD